MNAPTLMDTYPTVLIADDDPVARKLIRNGISDVRHHVVSLDPEESFLEKVRSLVPDIILLDIYLRNLNGVDLVEQLRQDPLLQNIPIVMITSDASRETRDRALLAGADDVLVKPLDMQRLQSHLHVIQRMKSNTHVQGNDRYQSYLADASGQGLLVVDDSGYVRACNETARQWFGVVHPQYRRIDELIYATWEPIQERSTTDIPLTPGASTLMLATSHPTHTTAPALVRVAYHDTPSPHVRSITITDVWDQVQDETWRVLVGAVEHDDDIATMRSIAQWYEHIPKGTHIQLTKVRMNIIDVVGEDVPLEGTEESWMHVISTHDTIQSLANYLRSLVPDSQHVHMRLRSGRLHLYVVCPGKIDDVLHRQLRAAESLVYGVLRDSDRPYVRPHHIHAVLQAWTSYGGIRLLKRTDKPTQIIVDIPLHHH